MAARREAAKAVNESAQTAQDNDGIYLDPALVDLRDREAARNNVEFTPREEPTLDPALLDVMAEERKREQERNAHLND